MSLIVNIIYVLWYQCLQLIRIRRYSYYGFFAVCTDIRKLCSIIRKVNLTWRLWPLPRSVSTEQSCRFQTSQRVMRVSLGSYMILLLLLYWGFELRMCWSTGEAVFFLFFFSFFVSACPYLYCSMLFFLCVWIFFSYFMPVLFIFAFLWIVLFFFPSSVFSARTYLVKCGFEWAGAGFSIDTDTG